MLVIRHSVDHFPSTALSSLCPNSARLRPPVFSSRSLHGFGTLSTGPHSSTLAWRIPGTGGPGGLPSMGSHGVGHDWSDLAAATGPKAGYAFKTTDTSPSPPSLQSLLKTDFCAESQPCFSHLTRWMLSSYMLTARMNEWPDPLNI